MSEIEEVSQLLTVEEIARRFASKIKIDPAGYPELRYYETGFALYELLKEPDRMTFTLDKMRTRPYSDEENVRIMKEFATSEHLRNIFHNVDEQYAVLEVENGVIKAIQSYDYDTNINYLRFLVRTIRSK